MDVKLMMMMMMMTCLHFFVLANAAQVHNQLSDNLYSKGLK